MPVSVYLFDMMAPPEDTKRVSEPSDDDMSASEEIIAVRHGPCSRPMGVKWNLNVSREDSVPGRGRGCLLALSAEDAHHHAGEERKRVVPVAGRAGLYQLAL